MKSAFGIEHTVSKSVAYGPGGLPRSRKLIALGRGARKAFEGTKKAGHKVATTEVSVQSIGRGTGLATGAVGRGAGRVGEAFSRHPEATGAAIGGGAAGYGVYRYNKAKKSTPKPKSKPKTPEAM